MNLVQSCEKEITQVTFWFTEISWRQTIPSRKDRLRQIGFRTLKSGQNVTALKWRLKEWMEQWQGPEHRGLPGQ